MFFHIMNSVWTLQVHTRTQSIKLAKNDRFFSKNVKISMLLIMMPQMMGCYKSTGLPACGKMHFGLRFFVVELKIDLNQKNDIECCKDLSKLA